ncbi:MAG: hypothetical protein CFK52_01930 [Chloracidobacterium sp. CP2_5A]|nr:MAG: hypothetical protein CFK52_01930 [Chloracidobacterium sp. CP2_5A]
MMFAFRMLWRELRAMWRQMAFFFLCLAVGAGLIIALRSATQNLRVTLAKQSRNFLAADVQISGAYPALQAARAKIDECLNEFPGIERTDIVEVTTGVIAVGRDNATRAVVRAIDPAYTRFRPLQLVERDYADSLLSGQGAIVTQSVADQLQLSDGSQVKIGSEIFTMRGTVRREGGQESPFAATGVLLVTLPDLKKTGLLATGSTGRLSIKLLVGDDPRRAEAVAQALRSTLATAGYAPLIETARDRQAQSTIGLGQAEGFFGLVGLAVTMLGGIGIASVTQTFIRQRIRAIAILKCLGASNGAILGVYIAQMGLLGLAGGAFGWALAKLAQWRVGPLIAARFPFPIEFALTWSAIGQGLAAGVAVALAFSATPLLGVRQVKPSALIRSRIDGAPLPWRLALAVGAGSAAALFGLFVWQAGSAKLGQVMFIGLAAVMIALYGASVALLRSATLGRRIPVFALRYGLAALRRPGNQTLAVTLTVGLGLFFTLTVRLLDRNLLAGLDLAAAENLPNLLLFNVLPSQVEAARQLVQRRLSVEPTFIPIVSARLTALNGQRIDFAAIRDEGRRAALDREFRVTYRPNLDPGEKVIAGEWWDGTPAPRLEVSLDSFVQRNLGAQVGDTVTLDIQGREIVGVIRSVRQLEFRRLRQAFAIVARPGVLEQAPQTLIGAVKVDGGDLAPEAVAPLRLDLIRACPNVSLSLAGDFLKTVREIIGGLQTAFAVVGSAVLLSGIGMLVGAMAMTRYQRQYETALLKTLGARSWTLIGLILVEYGALGTLAALIGGGGALGASWYVTVYVLRLEWLPFWGDWLIGTGATIGLVALVGSLASWDILHKKPLGALRGGD